MAPRQENVVAGRLQGKRALITAAAQGIGRASAEAFIREGAHVIATDIDTAGLSTLAGADRHGLDVTDGAQIEALAARVGAIDILFNCAGVVHGGTILECTDAQWDQAFALNARAQFRMVRALSARTVTSSRCCCLRMRALEMRLLRGFPVIQTTRTEREKVR